MQTLPSFRNAHRDEIIVVCGCGESLNEFDCPERFVTIGVNDVSRHFHPNYLVVLNPRQQFTGDRFDYIETSRAEFIFTQLDLDIARTNIVRFRLGTYAGTDFRDPNILHHTQNSPYVAICLAAHMGAKRIGLIGVDFTNHHFFKKTGQHPLNSQIEKINAEYSALSDALQAKGVSVFNLSSRSCLAAFPNCNIQQLLNITSNFDKINRSGPSVSHGEKNSEIHLSKVKNKQIKVVVEKHRIGIIKDFMDAFSGTAARLGYKVSRHVANNIKRKDALSVVWNGRRHRSAGPTLYCEHGWLPRWYYQLSFLGINADSHIAPFRWNGKPLTDAQQKKLARHIDTIKTKGPVEYGYMQTERGALKDLPSEFFLVPLQIESDTNIQRHVPTGLNRMQNLVDYVEGSNPPYPVIFKQHPADCRRGNSHLRLRIRRSADTIQTHGKGNIHQILKSGRCKGIISLNSNVVHDGLLWDVPAIALGKNVWPQISGPFMTRLPERWDEFNDYFARDDVSKIRAAYAHYLMQNQWSLADVQDGEKIASLLRCADSKSLKSVSLATRGSITPGMKKLFEINIVAENKGWLFEDFKTHFSNTHWTNARIITSDRPAKKADTWIFLRTKEAAHTPNPKRTIVQIHDMYDNGMYRKNGERFGATKCKGFVLTNPDQQYILEASGVNLDEKLLFCRPIGPQKSFTPRRSLSGRFSIGWVGRPVTFMGEDIKRITWFVEAVSKVAIPSHKFEVVFMGERLEPFCSEMQKLKVHHRYYPRKHVPIEQYPRLYHNLDCLVITACQAARPMSLFEALASGVPVVSTPVGWAKEWIRNEKNGYLVKDVAEISRALQAIYEKREDWFKKREKIPAVLKGFTLESWLEENIRMAVRVAKERRA
ncbi:MAG: glycosyltransferase [Desulfobacterales bacterium]|jgi:glycosyltransferase involved in cell wall biosynthesis